MTNINFLKGSTIVTIKEICIEIKMGFHFLTYLEKLVSLVKPRMDISVCLLLAEVTN